MHEADSAGPPQETLPGREKVAERTSVWLERMVQVLLGVVLGQAFLKYENVILTATAADSRTATLALVLVFFIALSSWIALSRRVSEAPYDPDGLAGKVRFYSDVAAVCLYAYLLIQVRRVSEPPHFGAGSLTDFWWGCAAVFACYAVASFARGNQIRALIAAGSTRAPRPWRAVSVSVFFIVVASCYKVVEVKDLLAGHRQGLNQILLLGALAMAALYRLILPWRTAKRRPKAVGRYEQHVETEPTLTADSSENPGAA